MFIPKYFSCITCNRTYAISQLPKTCIKCNSTLIIKYDYDKVNEKINKKKIKERKNGVWKYSELLPINHKKNRVSLGEGGTFLQKCSRLAKELGLTKLYLKNETLNPTGSYIDRGTTVLTSRIKEIGFKNAYCAPAGNLGASLAAYTAKAGIDCKIFVSNEIDLGKLYQMIACNANIKLAKNFEDATLKMEAINNGGYPVVPTDPYLLEGKKTIAFEICEQMDWKTPTRIIASMGTGGLLSMMWKGIQELHQINIIQEVDIMMTGVQAKGCSPIVTAFKEQKDIEPQKESKTIARDIKVNNPILGKMALKAIEASKGTATNVSDSQILEAIRILAKTEGIYAEPSAASTIAGLKKLVIEKEIDRNEEVVCIITGAGLKDLTTTRRLVDKKRKVQMLINDAGSSRPTRLGKTKLQILKVLFKKDCYGYGIRGELTNFYKIKITIPSIYQHLSELEILGLIKKNKIKTIIRGRTRVYYSITKQGKKMIDVL